MQFPSFEETQGARFLFCFVSMQFREIVLDFYHRILECSSNLISMLSLSLPARKWDRRISLGYPQDITSRVISFPLLVPLSISSSLSTAIKDKDDGDSFFQGNVNFRTFLVNEIEIWNEYRGDFFFRSRKIVKQRVDQFVSNHT